MLAATGVGEDLGGAQAVVAAIGFLIAASLWSYFGFIDEEPLQQGLIGWPAYLYAHLAVFAGTTATGVGVLKVIVATPDQTLADGARWALCGGPAAFLIALGAMRAVSVGSSTPVAAWSRIGAGLVLAALAATGSTLSPLALVVIVLGVLVLLISIETIRPTSAPPTRTQPHPREA